ncbi:MAG: hypothetical protein E6K90_10370, partial [Thaumarchaeota archaeon]
MGPASRGLKKFLAASSTLVMLLLTLAILAQPAAVNAMGDAPSTCNNRYDGRITYFIISNGTRTFNAIANPGVTFDVKANSYYNVTFVIH